MKHNSSTSLFLITALFCAGALVGCADYASVGVGYPASYYAPDYTPFYASYFYDGGPYWGPNVSYVRKRIVVRDVDRNINVNRNVYYGGHHFVGAGNWHGGRASFRAGGGGFRRGRG